MSAQELTAGIIGLVAVGYLALRLIRRRGGNCCGESECPAAKEVTQRLERIRR